MEREEKESKEIARAVLLPLLRLQALSNSPQLQQTWRTKKGHLKQPSPSLIPTPAALPLPPQVLMFSLLCCTCEQPRWLPLATPRCSGSMRRSSSRSSPPALTARACRSSAGRCSAAPWGGHAEPWDLQRSPLTGEWFSLRCSAASAGMCKQTVCRPINHSPPGSFS